jgi:hypothetical protein
LTKPVPVVCRNPTASMADVRGHRRSTGKEQGTPGPINYQHVRSEVASKALQIAPNFR